MAQSLSRGSGDPSRMTLTVICSFRTFSDMRENYSMRRFGRLTAPQVCNQMLLKWCSNRRRSLDGTGSVWIR